jgi:hypothetical protein
MTEAVFADYFFKLLAAPQLRAFEMGIVAVVAIIFLIGAWKSGMFQAQDKAADAWRETSEAAEAYAKFEVAAAENRMAILQQARAELEAVLAKERTSWEKKFNTLRTSLQAEIEELRRKVDCFGCLNAPTCDNRVPLEETEERKKNG